DASDMAETLTKLGFEVTLGLDLDQQQFARTIDRFARQLDDASVGLLFYAGHGIQINEKNFLVSTNAKLDSEFLVTSEAIELNAIIALMESKVPTNLVFLDACRNNPLSERLRQNLAATKRSANMGRGLARVEPTGRDTLIAFAAAPGQEAADGRDRNSPFTAALLKHLPKPGLEVSVMLKEVAAEVRRTTKNEQRPQQLSDMTRTFYFAKAEPAAVTMTDATALPAVATTPAPAPAPRMDERSLELAYWNTVQSSNDCGSTRAYLQQFPNGIFAELARLAERRLCTSARQVTVTDASPPETPASTAAPAAALPPAPLPQGGETAKPGPVIAALPAAPAPGMVSSATTDGRPELARNIQLELIRLGCFAGEADGNWSAGTRSAMVRINKAAKSKFDANAPSAGTLAALQKRQGRACPLECGRGYQARGNTCVAVKSEPRKPRVSERSVEKKRSAPTRQYVEEEPVARPAFRPAMGGMGMGGGIPIGIGIGFGRR
ncbi:MAG TPA: caspase family protein, partial [Pirellulales bacterium]|nr:caspase family protein [Pirellulales bacterium]